MSLAGQITTFATRMATEFNAHDTRLDRIEAYDAPQASDLGMKTWTCDPAVATGSSILLTGRIRYGFLPVRRAMSFTGMGLSIQTLGSGITSSGVALYDMSGSLLSQPTTANADFTSGSTGLRSWAFSPAVTRTAGQHVVAAVWNVGGTQTTLHRASSDTDLATLVKTAPWSSPILFRNAITPAASIASGTAPGTMPGSSTVSVAYWFMLY